MIVIIFFTLFFIVGFSLVKDYGVSWDEEFQWKENGTVVYNYIFKGNKNGLINGTEKYHGPVFELLLIIVEKALNVTDLHDIYLLRHVITFLTFFIGVLFFYFLCKRCFGSWKIALLGCIFLILSPRIFADSFYNSKDSVLLSFFIIAAYALMVFHERPTYKNAIAYALSCALTIDVRILGIILPFVSGMLFLIRLIYNRVTKNKSGSHINYFVVYVVFLAGFTILFWPILWEDPITHFHYAFQEMSKFQWDGKVLYLGDYIPVSQLPWHYLSVWFFISTPISYLLLFFLGLFSIIYKVIHNQKEVVSNMNQYLLFLTWFFSPFLMVILFKSVVYDGWRHVFFVYPAFVVIALYGVRAAYCFFKKQEIIFVTLLAFIVLMNAYTMVKLHPYQNVYFNSFAGKNRKEIRYNFELDYWGVSSKQALEYLLQNDASSVLKVYPEQPPQELNVKFLPPDQRKRIALVALRDADYFIAQYRWHREDYRFEHEFYSIKADGIKIMSIFKLTDEERKDPYNR